MRCHERQSIAHICPAVHNSPVEPIDAQFGLWVFQFADLLRRYVVLDRPQELTPAHPEIVDEHFDECEVAQLRKRIESPNDVLLLIAAPGVDMRPVIAALSNRISCKARVLLVSDPPPDRMAYEGRDIPDTWGWCNSLVRSSPVVEDQCNFCVGHTLTVSVASCLVVMYAAYLLGHERFSMTSTKKEVWEDMLALARSARFTHGQKPTR